LDAASGSKTGAAPSDGGTVPGGKGAAPVSLGPSGDKGTGPKSAVKLGPDGVPLGGEQTGETQAPGLNDLPSDGETGVPEERKTRIQSALEASGQGGERVEISDMETLWTNFQTKDQGTKNNNPPASEKRQETEEKPSFWKQFLGK
jgi:hypothetical protein